MIPDQWYDDKLIQGDRPIIEYRRRQALIDAAATQKGQDEKA